MSGAPPPAPGTLTRRVFAGGAWGLVGTLGQAGAGVAAALVTARLLSPEDFAVAAIAGVLADLAGRLGHVGLVESLIKEREEIETLAQSAFVALAGLGALLASVLVAAIPLLTRFYDEPRLAGAVLVVALSLFLGLANGVPRALLQRSLRLKEINVLQTAQRFVAAAFAIALALSGAGFWALVLPGTLAQLLATPVLFRLARFRPRLRFAWERVRRTLPFGAGVFGSRLLGFLGDDLDYVVLGRYLPRDVFGQYYFAFTRARVPYAFLGAAAQDPLFAAFSEVGADRPRLVRAVSRVASVHFAIFGPLFFFLFLLADPLIPFLFGPQWSPSIPLCRAFALMNLLPAAGGFTGSVLFALGRSWLMFGLNVLRVAVVVAVLAWGVASGRSAFEIGVALAAVTALVLSVHLVWLFRILGAGVGDARRMYGPTLLAAGIATAAFAALRLLGWSPSSLPAPAYLLGAGAVLGLAYLVAARFLNRPVADEVLPWLKERIGR